MAVRLETERGMVKTYRTSFGINCVEPQYLVGDYKSKCGREWKGEEPSINDECDHLECAIWANKQYSQTFKRLSLFMIASGLVCMLLGWAFGSESLYSFGLIEMCLAVIPGIYYLYYRFKVICIKEFIDKGTIRGVNAHQKNA
ncbi:MAG: hypothetical protein ACP5PV_04580 [Methanothrix sp.]